MSESRAIPTDSTPLERAILRGEIDAEIVTPDVPTPTVPDAARALGVDETQIIKSLLFADRAGNVVLAIAPGPAKVNRDRLSSTAGLGKLSLASPDVVLARTGYPAGGTPPVGHVEPVPVIVDARVAEMDLVYGGGGKIDLLLRISPAEIIRVTGAKVVDIVNRG